MEMLIKAPVRLWTWRFGLVIALVALLMPIMPVQGGNIPSGGATVVRSSDAGFMDQLLISVTDIYEVEDGKAYYGWLSSDDGSDVLAIGELNIAYNEGTARAHSSHALRHGYTGADGEIGDLRHTYTSGTGENILAKYSAFQVTVESEGSANPTPTGKVAFQDTLPASSLTYLRDLLVSRSGNPVYSTGAHVGVSKAIIHGLHSQASLSVETAILAANGATLDEVKDKAYQLVNIIEGPSGSNYNVSFDDPGDGFGLLPYAADAKSVAEEVVVSNGDRVYIGRYAPGVVDSADNVALWAGGARDKVLETIASSDLTEAIAKIEEAKTLLGHALSGLDSNEDGSIRAVAGEGGAAQVRTAAQDLASFGTSSSVRVYNERAMGGNSLLEVALPDAGDINLGVWAFLALIIGTGLLGSGTFVLVRARN